jgi:hypothetical protein
MDSLPCARKKEEKRMKLTNHEGLRTGGWMELLLMVACLTGMGLGISAQAQAVSTTTVQGTVYLANGQPGTGTLELSWPSFTTASGQLVAADSTTVMIAPDGFVSVNLAANQGATPAGQYYTAVYYLSDGTTTTEYWVVPAAAQATLGQVQAQLMPAAQAVQAVSKAYVDQTIAELTGSLLTASGGMLTGPLSLCCDPTQPLQAADKHYVDDAFALAVPLAGGSMTGALTTPAVNGVESPAAGSSQTTLQATMDAAGSNGAVEIPPSYAGTDKFNNPNGVYVTDLRQESSQQFERSVKEFGAVCDGTTDDTNALQSALNYAETHGVALTIPQGSCKTRTLIWHGESIGGMGKQVSALMGFPGQDVLLTMPNSANILANTRIHDLTIYVDQSLDASCSAAKGVAPAGSCAENRPLESNSIFSPGGNGLTGTAGTGTAWAVGNCAIAMPATTGVGGNGLKVAEIENVEIAATGVDPMAAQYPGAHSTHTCGLYLAQWPQWSEFRNIDIRGLNTGIAIPALLGTTPAGLNSDSNRWQNITIEATHGFTAAAGSNNVLDNVVVMAGNSAATGEPPTGLVLDFAGTQQGWTVRNSVVLPVWDAVQPALTVLASGGAVTGVTVGSQAGLGFDPYGTQVPLTFSGSCTAQAVGNVNSNGTIGTVTVTQGGVGCSGTTTASVNVAGTWDTSAPVNLIAGQNITFYGGNLLKGNGGYTVWNAADSMSYGTQLDGGGGNLPGGGTYAALMTGKPLGSAYPVDQFPGVDFGAKLQACLSTVSASYGGTCDARNFTGALSMGSNLTISTANATIQLPCATIATANQVIVTAGTRNVSLRGCALRGASTASGSQGGTVFLYSGTGAMVQVGDPTYAADTMGFHLDNVVINTTASASGTAQGLTAYRTQELDLESLYFLGNSNQTGMTLDGTGNYTGGTFLDNEFTGFLMAVNAIGHQIANSATTDWINASTFVRLHIDCPTSGGSPINGTYGINLAAGDGNTFTGGDVEGCATALHLGTNAQNNTIIGLRNENSTNQVVADAGSTYNNWMTGGTMFTGQLTDNGTRNSFLDTFHRSFNGLNGDWYGSQKDATVTNHYRLGIGAGSERGLLNRYQTDSGYRWTMGLSDATAGEQFYQILDELNNVYRISVGQYNNGPSSANNQTVINAAGTGAVVLNGSTNAGTGGVVIGSGGASETTVATISNAGNAQFNGTLQVGGTSTLAGTPTVKNQADAEIDATLWAGLTTSQKESFIYKDWNGNSQWYMVKDQNNNWALNSSTGGLDSFKAYQSTNSGDTYIDASNSSGTVRINYESGSGAGFNIYGGNNSSLYASFAGTTAIKFPGLAASSGHNCLQIDNSGFITNTGAACGSGSGGGSGTVNAGTSGQIAFYSGNGTAISGTNTVSVTAGGTGSSTASGALADLGGISSTLTTPQTVAGPLTAFEIGPLLECDQFPGSDMSVKINHCVIYAMQNGQSLLDARNFTGTQTISQQMNIGTAGVLFTGAGAPSISCTAATMQGAFYHDTSGGSYYVCQDGAWSPSAYDFVGMTVLLPAQGQWNVTIQNPAACAIMQYNATSLIGTGAAAGGNPLYLNMGSSAASLNFMYCTPPQASDAGGGAYIRMSGLRMNNNALGNFAGGVVDIQYVDDQSRFENFSATGSGAAVIVDHACCGTTIDHAQIDSGYGVGGGTPFTISHSDAVTVSNSTISAAGTGYHNILLGAGNQTLDFINDYAETNGASADTTTSVVGLANDSLYAQAKFIGGYVALGAAKPCFGPLPSVGLVNLGFCGETNYADNQIVNQLTVGNANTQTQGLLLTAGQVIAGMTSFTPTTIGYYRIYTGGAPNGTLDIMEDHGNGSTKYEVQVDFSISPNGLTAPRHVVRQVPQRNAIQIQKIYFSSDGGTNQYVDLYIGSVTPYPIYIVFKGQGMYPANIVTVPVAGAIPGAYSVDIVDLTNLGNANYPELQTGDPIQTPGLTTDYGAHSVAPPAATNGTLALTSQLPSLATTLTPGLVQPDGTTISVNGSGVISAAGFSQPTVAQAPGDLACAMAADPTIGAWSVTGISSTPSTMTFTGTSTPTYFYVGQKVQAQGNTTAGYNGGPWTVASVTGSTVVVTSAANPGAGTAGGTLSLYCSNRSTDGGGNNISFANGYTVPANYFTVSGSTVPMLNVTSQLSFFSSSASPTTLIRLYKGSTIIATPAGAVWSVVNNSAPRAGSLSYQLTGLSPTLINTDVTGFALPTTTVQFQNGTAQPIIISASAETLTQSVSWTATGVASITSSSGCTVVGTIGQTVLLTAFNDSSTATATGTLTTANTITGATWVMTSRGQSATAAPTSATCSAGGGNPVTSASGTATLTTTLGGAAGNALLQRDFIVRPY